MYIFNGKCQPCLKVNKNKKIEKELNQHQCICMYVSVLLISKVLLKYCHYIEFSIRMPSKTLWTLRCSTTKVVGTHGYIPPENIREIQNHIWR